MPWRNLHLRGVPQYQPAQEHTGRVMPMMVTRQVVCVKCSTPFTIHEETSRQAHLLHCVRCGRDKRITRADLKACYYRYISTLLTSPLLGMRSLAAPIRPLFSDEQIDTRKYIHMVEHLAGSCICGATFRFSGKPRCPRCRSAIIRTEQEKMPPILLKAHLGDR